MVTQQKTLTSSPFQSYNRGSGYYVDSRGQGISTMKDPGVGYTKVGDIGDKVSIPISQSVSYLPQSGISQYIRTTPPKQTLTTKGPLVASKVIVPTQGTKFAFATSTTPTKKSFITSSQPKTSTSTQKTITASKILTPQESVSTLKKEIKFTPTIKSEYVPSPLKPEWLKKQEDLNKRMAGDKPESAVVKSLIRTTAFPTITTEEMVSSAVLQEQGISQTPVTLRREASERIISQAVGTVESPNVQDYYTKNLN